MSGNYAPAVQKELQRLKIAVGQRIAVTKGSQRYEGILMPKSAGDPAALVLKLDSGYNIGVAFAGAKIAKLKEKKELKKETRPKKAQPDPSKPTITLLTTGGTIASRVDYKTGAVMPLESAGEIVEAIPELGALANVRTRPVFQMFSEDIEPFHWVMLAEKIADEIKLGTDGIIITHGTDTLHYTAAALSFMVQDAPVPIVLVGAQRSSDRGSSDAAMNLLCAAQFIAKSDFAGLAVCMHASMSDDYCFIHPGLHVKKMHASRRDAFRSIDVLPYAKVNVAGEIVPLRKGYQLKDRKRSVHLVDRFDSRVALLKTYPGFDYRVLEAYEKAGYRGIVLEGTGLGHAPITATDDFTKGHAKLLEVLQRLSKKMVIIMASQCPYGKVNMDVYATGRLLQAAGVIPAAMQPETAYVKLGWVLGHTKDISEVKQMMQKNYVGEFIERIDAQAFLY